MTLTESEQREILKFRLCVAIPICYWFRELAELNYSELHKISDSDIGKRSFLNYRKNKKTKNQTNGQTKAALDAQINFHQSHWYTR